jgi:hypothetical protein
LWKPHHGFPFSVSKVNQLTGLYVALVWLGLAISSFPLWPVMPLATNQAGTDAIALFTIVTLIFFVWWGRGGSQGKEREVDFYKSPLVPPKKR